MPVYDPSGNVTFTMQDFGAPLAKPNFVGRQWKNTGDYNVAIRINDLGFRDARDVSDAKKNDLVFVGDSFTFGWGVGESERFSNQLDAMLGIRTFNIAVPSTNFAGYQKLVLYAEERGASIGHLVIGVCMENDLCNYERHARRSTQHRDAGFSFGRMFSTTKKGLAAYTSTYHALTSFVHRTAFLRKAFIRIGLVKDNFAGMRTNDFDKAEIISSVNQLVELSSNYDSTIIIIPSRGLWIGDNQRNERLVHDAFVERLRQHRLTVVDLRPVFEQCGEPLNYHFEYDGHWNPDGHEVAAKTIASRLVPFFRDN